jgi:hypothetical protein
MEWQLEQTRARSPGRTLRIPASDTGIIVVTLNYRLGVLGFLAHPALTAATMRTQQITSPSFGPWNQAYRGTPADSHGH